MDVRDSCGGSTYANLEVGLVRQDKDLMKVNEELKGAQRSFAVVDMNGMASLV